MRQTDLYQVDTYRISDKNKARTGVNTDSRARKHLHMHEKWRSALEIIVENEVGRFEIKIELLN